MYSEMTVRNGNMSKTKGTRFSDRGDVGANVFLIPCLEMFLV